MKNRYTIYIDGSIQGTYEGATPSEAFATLQAEQPQNPLPDMSTGRVRCERVTEKAPGQ